MLASNSKRHWLSINGVGASSPLQWDGAAITRPLATTQGLAPRSQRFADTWLQPKGVDQRGQRGWLLPATWIVEEESRKRLAPVLQHTHQRPTCEICLRLIL